jgi:hypothetical protein
MENADNQNEIYDLSGVLGEKEFGSAKRTKEGAVNKGDVSGVYDMVFRLSGGKINTEGQARIIIIIFLIIINVVTYMIASGRNGII